MKKWLPALLIVPIAALYIFIPSTLTVAGKKAINCNVAAANRFLQDPARWTAWWPGKQVSRSAIPPYGVFDYQGTNYSIEKILYNGLTVSAVSAGVPYYGSINLIQTSKDTTIVQFNFNQETSFNPVTRFNQFRQSKKLQKEISDLQNSLNDFLQNKQKVYGIKFQRILNGERALIVLDSTFNHKPGTEEVNNHIARLRGVVNRMGAMEISHPMLHISTADSLKYFMMVAVQTNIKLELEGKMYYKHTYPGYVLVADVTGGQAEIDNAIAQMKTYIQDYEIVSPAIPYAEMVTDRSSEKDSSKWMSRIYYPIF